MQGLTILAKNTIPSSGECDAGGYVGFVHATEREVYIATEGNRASAKAVNAIAAAMPS